MKKMIIVGGAVAIAFLATGFAQAADESTPVIYAAGSLRTSIDDIVKKFEERTGIHFSTVYGPSGKLRADIEAGKPVGVFASASTEHTDALAKKGLLKGSAVFASNSMCLMAGPGVDISRGDIVDKMLEPAIRIGTSTPKMDPGGDYAWLVFQNAEKVHPGAYSELDRKAQKLVGNPAIPARSVPDILKGHEVDVFVTYCSYAAETGSKIEGATWRKFPETINVIANYGIGVATAADKRSDQLVQFILGAEGQRILTAHGFEVR